MSVILDFSRHIISIYMSISKLFIFETFLKKSCLNNSTVQTTLIPFVQCFVCLLLMYYHFRHIVSLSTSLILENSSHGSLEAAHSCSCCYLHEITCHRQSELFDQVPEGRLAEQRQEKETLVAYKAKVDERLNKVVHQLEKVREDNITLRDNIETGGYQGKQLGDDIKCCLRQHNSMKQIRRCERTPMLL